MKLSLRLFRIPAAAGGMFWLLVFQQIVSNEGDIRARLALILGFAVALAMWGRQLHARRLRWWRTAAFGAAAALLSVVLIHMIGGGDLAVLPWVAVEIGIVAALHVAIGPATSFHLLSFGTGWGAPLSAPAGSASESEPQRQF